MILDDFPELRYVENAAERAELVWQCDRRVFRHMRAYVVLVFIAMCLIPAALIGLGWLHTLAQLLMRTGLHRGLAEGVVKWAASLLPLALTFLFCRRIFRHRRRRELRRDLCARGIPVCLHCGYNLRGQTEPHCPECGAAFDLQLLEITRNARADFTVTRRH